MAALSYEQRAAILTALWAGEPVGEIATRENTSMSTLLGLARDAGVPVAAGGKAKWAWAGRTLRPPPALESALEKLIVRDPDGRLRNDGRAVAFFWAADDEPRGRR